MPEQQQGRRWACAAQPPPQLSQLQALRAPALLPPGPALPAVLDVAPGEPVCVRVAVPPGNSSYSGQAYAPIPGWPWDALELLAEGEHFHLPFDFAEVPLNASGCAGAGCWRLYEAEVVLRDSDTYHLEAIIEYRDGLWNFDREGQKVPLEPLVLTAPFSLRVRAAVPLADAYAALPRCTRADHPGRYVPAALLGPAAGLLPTNNHGETWLPWECKYEAVSHPRFARCLAAAGRRTWWFGDSNSRRSFKHLASYGAW